MLKKRIIIFFLITFPWILYAQTGVGKDSVTKTTFVQILSSYTYADDWDTTLAKSLCNKMASADPQADVIVTYAGIGNLSSFLTERFAMQGAFSSGRLTVTRLIPDVLVLIGDESWMLYRIMNLRGLWEKVPVVLCGVSSEIMKDYSLFFPDRAIADSMMIPLTESLNNLPVTGVMLHDYTAKTLEMIKNLLPDTRELVFLANGSYQDVLAEKQLRKALQAYPALALRTIVSKQKTDSIPKILAHLPSTTLAVVNMFNLDFPCPVPVISLRESSSKEKYFLGGNVAPIEEISTCATQMIVQLYNGRPADSIPFVYVDERPILNKESVIHFGLSSKAKKLSGVVFRNIPPPFFVRYIRIIAFLAFLSIVLFFSILISIRSRSNSKRLKDSLDTFKQLYGKYQTVYKSMPLGLLSLNKEGYILKRNKGSNTFMELYSVGTREEFNLFRANILNAEEVNQVKNGASVGFSRWIGKYSFRFIIRSIQDEETGESNILLIIADNTESALARIEKEKVHEMLHFALNASALGVAEYNLVDQKGFATQAWYKNMGVEAESTDFTNVHQCILPEYKAKVDSYFDQIKKGAKNPFLDTVQVQLPCGEKHWIRFLIQLMEYDPDNGSIVVTELAYNVDEQVVREEELLNELRNAREADRLKNSFIVNMRDEIRIPLRDIMNDSVAVTKEKDMEVKLRLIERIERNNQVLLMLLDQLIDMAKKNEE